MRGPQWPSYAPTTSLQPIDSLTKDVAIGNPQYQMTIFSHNPPRGSQRSVRVHQLIKGIPNDDGIS